MCVFGYRVSSEDSGELPFYIEDSDDSCELEPEARQTGQMSLLEEILDSLSTTTLDHGSKLSSAKSLDFFRSMDELDCSTPVRPDLGMFFPIIVTLGIVILLCVFFYVMCRCFSIQH